MPITTLSVAASASSSRPLAPRARSSASSWAVALDRAERGEVGQREPDQRAGEREHDVQGLRVERVAGGGVQLVGEIVDELHLAGQRALDAS